MILVRKYSQESIVPALDASQYYYIIIGQNQKKYQNQTQKV